MRGGFFPMHLAVVLNGDGFPEVTLGALGAWIRLRALGEFTGEPVAIKAAGRLGITPEMLAELAAAGIVSEDDGRYVAIGMPGIPRKPSDEPEATRARKVAERERAKERINPITANPIQSRVTPSRVTWRDMSDDNEIEAAVFLEKLLGIDSHLDESVPPGFVPSPNGGVVLEPGLAERLDGLVASFGLPQVKSAMSVSPANTAPRLIFAVAAALERPAKLSAFEIERRRRDALLAAYHKGRATIPAADRVSSEASR